MIITLRPEVEQALTEQARQQGTTPEHLALASLHKQFVETEAQMRQPQTQATLFDFLGPAIGILHSSEHVPGGTQMSTDSGRKFTEMLLKQRRQGRL